MIGFKKRNICVISGNVGISIEQVTRTFTFKGLVETT